MFELAVAFQCKAIKNNDKSFSTHSIQTKHAPFVVIVLLRAEKETTL
jgi:hypothetical protein